MVPAISSRSLDARGDQLFKIIERSFTDNARVDISSHLRDYYLVQYVYGFHLRGYVYFVQVQRRSHLRTQEELGVHSRISRVCSSDAGFHSYSEISLECAGHGARSGVAKTAYLASSSTSSPSTSASSSTGSSNDVHTLFVSFARDHGSTLCAFPMLELERKFDENIHLCYNGSVRSRNMDYIAGSLNECPEIGVSFAFFILHLPFKALLLRSWNFVFSISFHMKQLDMDDWTTFRELFFHAGSPITKI